MADELEGTPAEREEAERLDREISAALAGRSAPTADPVVLWLASATRPAPPQGLTRRVARRVERREAARWRPAQLVAATMAAVFAGQGVGNMVVHEWVAEGVGEPTSPHAFIEGGLALLAVAVVLAAALFTLRALPYAVAAGAPLGVAYGIRGIDEVGQFAAGAALHLTQGVLGVALFVLWWRARRYGSARDDEGEA